MSKPKKDKFYLVQEDILPEAIKKTIKVKEILKLGEVKTINEAVEKMDLSRSAYYKYKDYVFPFFEIAQGKIVSIYVSMSNESGMLSSVLKAIAERNGSIYGSCYAFKRRLVSHFRHGCLLFLRRTRRA